MAEQERLRLFFALWPRSATRNTLERIGRMLQQACGGRRMRTPGLHLTLVFLGSVEARRLDEVRAVAADICTPPFVLDIDRTGCWRHNRVAWAGTESAPEALLELVRALQDGLRAAGFAFDAHPLFAAHVTLLRNARCEGAALPAIAPWQWRIADFVLVSSVTREEGAAYEVVGRWVLEE